MVAPRGGGLMARRLKDLYPCNVCGVGVEVRSRADIQHARCAPCSEYKRLLSCSAYAAQRAQRLYDSHARTHDDVLDGAPWWLEAAGEAIKAAADLVKAAARTNDAAERAKWVRIALSWSKWGTSVNDRARAILSAQGVLPAVLVEAPPEPPQLSEPLRGHLTVVRGEVSRG